MGHGQATEALVTVTGATAYAGPGHWLFSLEGNTARQRGEHRASHLVWRKNLD